MGATLTVTGANPVAMAMILLAILLVPIRFPSDRSYRLPYQTENYRIVAGRAL